MKLKERLQKNNKMEPNNKSINSFFQNLKNKLLRLSTLKMSHLQTSKTMILFSEKGWG